MSWYDSEYLVYKSCGAHVIGAMHSHYRSHSLTQIHHLYHFARRSASILVASMQPLPTPSPKRTQIHSAPHNRSRPTSVQLC